MIRVCAWCLAWESWDGWTAGPAPEGTHSHGLCPECAERDPEELDALAVERKKEREEVTEC